MIIELKIVNPNSRVGFGKVRYYPTNRDGEIILQLLKQKSFTENQVNQMILFGWEVNIDKEKKK